MDPTTLKLTYCGLQATFPELKRFTGNRLPSFYSSLHAVHSFESFKIQGDSGAIMETEDDRRLVIERNGIWLDEYVQRDFALVRKDAADVLGFAKDEFGIGIFFLPEVTLRALWPLPQGTPPISELLRDNVVSLQDGHYGMLGDIEGVALRLVGTREDPPPVLHWHLELAPYLRDESQLYLELEATTHGPFETPELVGEFMDMTYEFLTNQVVHFVKSFMP